MPQDAPPVNRREVQAYGASLRLVDGLIGDAGRLAAEESAGQGWLDVSTFKEPYRVEGKKTMGLELAEDFAWRLPDVIIYPTGGGTGLVGMWKAFAELEALGWIGPQRPRLVSVQAAGCAPVVRAFHSGAARIEPWSEAQTLAAGLRVPAPFADRLILRALRESRGTAVAVGDEEILAAQRELARLEGIFAAPEGAAAVAALRYLLAGSVQPFDYAQGTPPQSAVRQYSGRSRSADAETFDYSPFDYAQGTGSQSISPSDIIVIFNTGSGLKYVP
jgi:threonine synthase